MKKNNGFTLIELIVVIVIISIIFILTIPQIQKTSINSKIKLCQNKLSLIEDSLNLFLSTNQECYDDNESNCYICTETKNNKCITNVERLAELGIVERDNENDVVNPINKTKINDYKIVVDYNYNSEEFTANFLSKEDENSIDSNYSSICGSNNGNGIIEGESNPSFNLKKDYNVILVKDNIEKTIGKKYGIQVARIATFCEQTLIDNETDGDEYGFTKYMEQNDNLYCYFEKKPSPTIKINISDEDSVKITNIINEKTCNQNNPFEYTCDSKQTIEIDYSVIDGVNIENISCSPNICEKDLSNNKIKINLRYDNVLVRIETESRYRLDYYIDEANGSDNSYQKYLKIPSTFVNTKSEAERICENNLDSSIISKYTVDKEYNLKVYRCKYNRKKFKINLKTDDYVLNSNVINDAVYKYEQTINLNFTFSEGYYFGNIDYANTSLTKEEIDIPTDILSWERENNENIIQFTMPSNDVDLSIISGKKYNMTVYGHFQNADNGNGYSTNIGKKDVFSVIPLDEQIDINQFCIYNIDSNIYTLSLDDNYYIKDKNEINCYYNRKLISVNINFADKYVTSATIVPSSNVSTSASTLSASKTISFRYGQKLILIPSYSQDYTHKRVECTNDIGCTTYSNGITKVIVPNINNYTITINSKDIVEKFTIYKHYQDTDNENGYTSVNKGTLDISLPANYDSKDETNLDNRDINNVNKYCTLSSEDSNIYTSNNAISYLVRDGHEINCYYDRKLVNISFHKESNISSIKYNINESPKILSTSDNDTKATYRYGQNIYLFIGDYVSGYIYNSIKCSNDTACTIGIESAKIKANEDIDINISTIKSE